MKKLTTKAGKLELSELWLGCRSGMGLYEPLRLLKVVGPLVVGIYLEPTRDGGAYTPTAHLHFLGAEFPTIGLTPALKGDLMTVAGTTQQGVAHAFSALVRLASFIADVPGISYSDLQSLYDTHVTDGRFPVVTAYLPTYSAMIGLATFVGHPDDARSIVDRVVATGESLPAKKLSRLDRWKEGLDALLDRDALVRRVQSEKEKHKLNAMPEVALIS